MAKERQITKLFLDGQDRCSSLGLSLVNGPICEMLDVGYGDGNVTQRFMKKLDPIITWGLDENPMPVKEIISDRWDVNEGLPFSCESKDFILSSQSIEHLWNTRFFLEECFRVLHPKGKLLIMTENLASWINIFSLVMGWTPFSLTNTDGWNIGNPIMKRDEKKEEDFLFQEKNYKINPGMVGHIRVPTYDGIKDLMTRIGFKTQVYTKGYLPFSGWLSDLMCKIDKKHGHFLIALGEK